MSRRPSRSGSSPTPRSRVRTHACARRSLRAYASVPGTNESSGAGPVVGSMIVIDIWGFESVRRNVGEGERGVSARRRGARAGAAGVARAPRHELSLFPPRLHPPRHLHNHNALTSTINRPLFSPPRHDQRARARRVKTSKREPSSSCSSRHVFLPVRNETPGRVPCELRPRPRRGHLHLCLRLSTMGA